MHEEFANNENIPEEISKSIESSILELSSYLPAKSLPSFARVAILSLKPDSPLEILESLLKALFGWNYTDAVKMIVGLLVSPITQINNKKAKELEIADSLDEAKFGLRLLDMTLRSNQLCQAVLGNIESVNTVLKALNQFMEQGKLRLETDEPSKIPDLLIISAIELKYRLLLHTNNVTKEVLIIKKKRIDG